MTMRDWLALDYYITDADQLMGILVNSSCVGLLYVASVTQ